MVRPSRLVLPAAVALMVFAGCSGPNPYQAARDGTTPASAAAPDTTTGVGENPFLPDGNLSDCVGTNERPNCGSAEKGTKGTYMTFAVLIAGLGFIFWRISIGVRARDKVMNADAAATPDGAAGPPPPDALEQPDSAEGHD